MIQFTIDEAACIQCGECARDCVYGVIGMDGGYPSIIPEKEAMCIECQHCMAVCQPGALSIFGLDPDDSIPLDGNLPEPGALETLMLGRRSTRRYRDEPVDPALIDHILDVVRNAPTGVNRRSTLLTLVEDRAAMDALRDRTYVALRKAVDAGNLPEGLEFFAGFVEAWENHGIDIIYRGAPHFLVASAPSTNPSATADSFIALTYFELLANSHGVGTVWDGLAKWALSVIAPDVLSMFDLPEDHTLGYMMAFGMPDVTYHRTVQRKGGAVKRITV